MKGNGSTTGRGYLLLVLTLAAILALVLAALIPREQLMASSDVVELPQPHPARLADRLSIIMRGVPASAEDKTAMMSGTSDLLSLAENYRSDERFAERLAQYWAQVLKIGAPFDFSMVESANGNSLLTELRESEAVARSRTIIYRKPDTCGASEQPRFELYFEIQENTEGVQAFRERCQRLVAGSQERQSCDADLARREERLTRTNNFREVHDCSCSQAIDVRPWWNPSSIVKVCPSALRACPMNGLGLCTSTNPANQIDICGANLAECMPRDSRIEVGSVPAFLDPIAHDGNRFFDEVITGLTLEPAMLIAKTIQEDRDYREVLNTTQTVLPGAVETFLLSSRGSMLRQQAAGQFNNGNTLRADQSERKTWRRVERGQGNAGVLTTPAFHQVTNGYRAKANRAYESFLCRKFVIPPGVVDGNPEETDLTKRQPCASCHIELEPLGNMFKRWPEESTNFLYTPGRNARGGFSPQPFGRFEEGEDTLGFANLLVKDKRFSECAVQRAFEFAVGREPSEYDIEHFFPKWEQKFISEGYKLWPVMIDIIQSVYFRGGWK